MKKYILAFCLAFMSTLACITASAETAAVPSLPQDVPVGALVGGIIAVLLICAVLIAIFKKKK